VPDAWAGWTFWQYSDSGRVPGVEGDVDLSHYSGLTTWPQVPLP